MFPVLPFQEVCEQGPPPHAQIRNHPKELLLKNEMMVHVQQGSLETLTVCCLTPRQFWLSYMPGLCRADKKLSFNSMTYGPETMPSVEMFLKAQLLKEK